MKRVNARFILIDHVKTSPKNKFATWTGFFIMDGILNALWGIVSMLLWAGSWAAAILISIAAAASSNFDRRTRPLINWQRLALPVATLALPSLAWHIKRKTLWPRETRLYLGFKYFQVSVSCMVVYNCRQYAE